MPDTPFPAGPAPQAGRGPETGSPRQGGHGHDVPWPDAATHVGRGEAQPTSPPNVWLCTPAPGAAVPARPVWAAMVIDALSVAGERVIVRALSGYPSLAAEAAALLDAASAAGRVGVALMPTPCLAARTRALVGDAPPHSAGFGGNPPATPERTKGTSSGMEASRSEDISCGPHGLGTTDGSTAIDQFSATNRFPAGGERAAIEGMAINGEVATSQFVAAGGSAATTPFAATCEFAAIGESGAGDGFAAGHPPVATGTRAVVGVGRRRAGLEMGVAAAVIVLAGPVAAGARLPRRSMPSARLLAEWSRVLPPGGVVAVLSPPPLGRHRARGGRWEGSPVPGLGEAGLSWTEHIVLVHAPTTTQGLDHPEHRRRPDLPFSPVHTCLDLFESDLAGRETSR